MFFDFQKKLKAIISLFTSRMCQDVLFNEIFCCRLDFLVNFWFISKLNFCIFG